MVFDVEEDCFAPNKLYEVEAYFQIEDDNGQAVDCDPFVYYQGLSSYCPDILIKKGKNLEIISHFILTVKNNIVQRESAKCI